MDDATRTASTSTSGAAAGDPTHAAGSRPWPLSPRHLRWLLPLGVAALALLVVALVMSVHESDTLGSMATIQTAGFSRPMSTTPVAFSLPVLGPDSGATPGAGPVSMVSLRGRPVVLNLWSSSCTECRRESPAVESVARRVGHQVEFVGVDTLDQRGTALRFLRRYQVTYLQVFDPEEQVGSGYGIPGLPVTVFVSSKGEVVGEYLGALDAKTLAHYLDTLFGVRLRG
ncbi:MAG: TlpA family protein disulfide reductase [Acidimicrobiales bacterium]